MPEKAGKVFQFDAAEPIN